MDFMDERIKIRNLVFEGKIDETIKTVNKLDEKVYSPTNSIILNILLNFYYNLVKCLIDYQIVRIQHPNQEYPFTTKLDYNIHEVLLGNTKIVKNGGHVLKVHGKKYDDVYDWAKKCFWWGKRASLFQTKVEVVNE